MTSKEKIFLIGIFVILLIVPVVYLARCYKPGLLNWPFIFKPSREMRQSLLYKTNHRILLDACRELSRQVASGNLKPGTYYVRSNTDPEVVGFPQPILDLNPSYVFIDIDGRMILAMAGGLDHFGVNAYPEDYKKPPLAGFELGDKKLIDGLWYYDNGYQEYRWGPKAYDKRIEALRPRE